MMRRVELRLLVCLGVAAVVAAAVFTGCGDDGADGGGGDNGGGQASKGSSSKYGIGLQLGPTVGSAEVGLATEPYLAWNKDKCEYEEVPTPSTPYKAETRKVEGDLQIGYMHYGDTDPFGVANSKSMKDVANEAGIKLNVYNLKYPSQTEALAQAKAAVLRKDQGVVQAQQIPAVNDAFLKILQTDACIPTVQMYLVTPNVPSMGADWSAVGVAEGEWLANYAKENDVDPASTALVSCTNPDLGESVNVIFDSAPKALADNGFELPSDNIFKLVCKDPQKSQVALTDWFTSHPDFDHVMLNTIDDERMQGMINAVEKTGNTDKAITIANGADELGISQIRSGKQMASIAFFPERYGEWLIPLMEDILAGNPVPSFTGSGLVAITPDNIDEYYPEG
jgi:ribose transport system substrate-binding protein